ncbi:hypothetical protein DEU56DRAFT_813955 [Suillus clintonianus]|uniref:uncharacterized protein n=1 Tax=Suillus clintonianus TaxID=1904413 RepID=UPI001B87886C|nr:uncharacterized protein DEU56DRAFT_813955 [Suillus clintonianus]KAG2131319.1 hypothetical protein DEU56DRAFT_813955 [Suillus clintonianus]
MRLSFVFAVVAALIVSTSASDAESDECPWYCVHDSTCSGCIVGECVSMMSSLRPGCNRVTYRRGRSSLSVTSVAVSHVSAFTSMQYG